MFRGHCVIHCRATGASAHDKDLTTRINRMRFNEHCAKTHRDRQHKTNQKALRNPFISSTPSDGPIP